MYTQEEINEYRKKWLAVLRDQESKKYYGELENPLDSNARCCLGHACHALGIDKGIQYDIEEDDKIGVAYNGSLAELPNEAASKLDINIIGYFKNPIEIQHRGHRGQVLEYKCYNLVNVNDSTPLTPKEIADIIEDQFKKDNFRPWSDED